MSVPVVTVPAAATLEDAVDSGFVTHLHGACPVVDASRVVGLRSLRVVRRFPAGRRRTVRARDVMSVEPALLIEPDTPVTELLSGTEFLRVGRAVVVDADGRPRGIISSTDVQRRAHTDELRSGGAPGTQRRLNLEIGDLHRTGALERACPIRRVQALTDDRGVTVPRSDHSRRRATRRAVPVPSVIRSGDPAGGRRAGGSA